MCIPLRPSLILRAYCPVFTELPFQWGRERENSNQRKEAACRVTCTARNVKGHGDLVAGLAEDQESLSDGLTNQLRCDDQGR